MRAVHALLCCALVAGGCSDSEPAPVEKANARPAAKPMSVLFLTVDTLRPDYLGMYGYDRPTSPYLDQLLAEGFHFPKAVTTVPRTTPACASLLTGSYPYMNGVRSLMDTLNEDVLTLGQFFRQSGYQTLAVVTNQVLGRERGLHRGFEVYDQAGDARGADQTTATALRHLKKMKSDRPLFAWIHYIDPHMPYAASPELAKEFDPDYQGRYELNFGQHPTRRKRNRGNEPDPEGQEQSKKNWGPFPDDLSKVEAVYENPLPAEANEHIRRLYAADIRFSDDHLKRVVDGVREVAGENLLIVFTSDHGESLGEHNYYYAHGEYVYNAASRVPLVFLLPESHPGFGRKQTDQWVSLVDVAPTVLGLVRLYVPREMHGQLEGRSLVPFLEGSASKPEPVFIESGHSHHFRYVRGRSSNDVAGRFRAVVLDDWKLIWAPGHEDADLSWQLYELSQDPHETNDLFRPDHTKFKELWPHLQAWASKKGSSEEPWEMTPEEEAILSELGYVEEGK